MPQNLLQTTLIVSPFIVLAHTEWCTTCIAPCYTLRSGYVASNGQASSFFPITTSTLPIKPVLRALGEEVRKRRPKAAGKLTPAALRTLRDGYAEQAAPVQQRQAEAQTLERRLADLVNQAYGLTPEVVELLRRTAPPRMPVGPG
jgi:hypothetical protein